MKEDNELEVNLTEDKALEEIKAQEEYDSKIANKLVKELLDLLYDKLNDEESDVKLIHVHLALARTLAYTTQEMFASKEHFDDEAEKAYNLAGDRIFPAFFPKTDGSVIVEENYDTENLSLRRMILTSAFLTDNIITQSYMMQYKDLRNMYDAEEKAALDKKTRKNNKKKDNKEEK